MLLGGSWEVNVGPTADKWDDGVGGRTRPSGSALRRSAAWVASWDETVYGGTEDRAIAIEEMSGRGSGKLMLRLRVRAGPMPLSTVWMRVSGLE